MRALTAFVAENTPELASERGRMMTDEGFIMIMMWKGATAMANKRSGQRRERREARGAKQKRTSHAPVPPRAPSLATVREPTVWRPRGDAGDEE